MSDKEFVREDPRGAGFGRVVFETVEDRVEDMLDNVIGPICDIPEGIWADSSVADISCYTDSFDKVEAEKQKEKILQALADRYNFENTKYWHFQSESPLAIIALYTLGHENTKKVGGGEDNA